MSAAHPALPADVQPPAHTYGFEDMYVRGFSYGGLLATGSTVTMLLGPSRGVTGYITTQPEGVAVVGRTSNALSITALTVVSPEDVTTTSVTGTLSAQGVGVDVEIPRDEPARGRLEGKVLEAESLEISIGSLEAPVSVGHLRAHDVSIRLTSTATHIEVRRVVLREVEARVPAGALALGKVIGEGFSCTLRPDQPPELSLEALRFDRASLGLSNARDVHVKLVEIFGSILRVGLLRAGEVEVEAGLGGRPEGDESSSSPVDLSFLSAFEGRLVADLATVVDAPLLPSWRAKHKVRLDVEKGRIRYDELEHGMNKLPDAVLDFNLRDARLCLDKDIPFVPFDLQTLVSWPLDDGEVDDAKEGWVKLSTLARPEIHIEPKDTGRDEGARFLKLVELETLSAAVRVSGGTMVRLPAGGRLRLGLGCPGGAHHGAIETLEASGHATYRPGPKRVPGALSLHAAKVAIALDELPVGEGQLDIRALTTSELHVDITLAELTPTLLCGTSRGLELQHLAFRSEVDG